MSYISFLCQVFFSCDLNCWVILSLSQPLSPFHRITEYPESEVTHKDCWVQLLAPHRTTQISPYFWDHYPNTSIIFSLHLPLRRECDKMVVVDFSYPLRWIQPELWQWHKSHISFTLLLVVSDLLNGFLKVFYFYLFIIFFFWRLYLP